MLMGFIPTYSFDVVPGIGLMAQIALLDLGVRLAGDRLHYHFEMSHIIMAWRRLMAFRAVLGARGGVLVPCNLSGRRNVAVGASAPKERVARVRRSPPAAADRRSTAMRILVTVAGKAIERLDVVRWVLAGDAGEPVTDLGHSGRIRL